MTRLCLPARKAPAAALHKLPAGACDSHRHIFGPVADYPYASDRSYTPPDALVDDCIQHLDAMGIDRAVLVTASVYGTDNRNLVDGLRRYPDRLRGVAVVDDTVSEATLDRLSEAGVCGARFYIHRPGGAVAFRNPSGLAELLALAPRLHARGWHAQIWIPTADLKTLAPTLKALPLPLVFDHMGGARATADGNALANRNDGKRDLALCVEPEMQAGFRTLLGMLADGRCWVKLSGADRAGDVTQQYENVAPLIDAFLQANTEHLLWGSDWPHVNYFDEVPDDAVLMSLIQRCVRDDKLRQQIFVQNPQRLYRFGPR